MTVGKICAVDGHIPSETPRELKDESAIPNIIQRILDLQEARETLNLLERGKSLNPAWGADHDKCMHVNHHENCRHGDCHTDSEPHYVDHCDYCDHSDRETGCE